MRQSPNQCHLPITIWTWCIEQNITLLAEHLLGQLNPQADEEPRTAKDHCNWNLHQTVFWQIQIAIGPLDVDLFASHLTSQLPCFYSWRPDPEAEATNALCIGSGSWLCQPTMVSNTSLPHPGEITNGTWCS